MGFHLSYGAVLASLLSPANPVAFLPLLLPVALVIAFLVVGRGRPQYRRAVPLLLIAVLIAFTLPLGIVPLQESEANWQVTGGTLKLDAPPEAATLTLATATWRVVAMASYRPALTKLNGFADPTLDSGIFGSGHGPAMTVLIYGYPVSGVLIQTPGGLYLIATPHLAALEGALRQESGPPSS